MEHAHCDDTELKRVLSPDRRLEIVIYDRSCSHGSGLYTYAVVQDHRDWFSWPRRPEFCYLVTLAGYYRLDARWLDNKHIEISSTDELEPGYNIASQHGTCNDIAVAYKFKFKPPPKQEAPDEQTVADIYEAINQTEGCIRLSGPYYADYLRSLVDNREHLQALELLCTNLVKGKCPISKETYALLERACTKMGIANDYLEDLKQLVRR